MTQNEVNEVIETSIEAFRAIQESHKMLLEENTQQATELTRLNGEVADYQSRVAELERMATRPAPEVVVPTPPTQEEISMDFNRQPELPSSFPVVRFLSKSSAMGGLANVRARMNDLGVNAKRMRLEGSSYVPPSDALVINWGGGFDVPSNMSGFSGRHLNKLEAVKIAANKLKTFEVLKEDNFLSAHIPGFTTRQSETVTWSSTYCRATLYGNSGEGITVVTDSSRLPDNPLYVEGMNIRNEYRVHTVNGYTKIQKKARLGDENCDMLVRNNAGGWTFINEFTLGDRGRSELHNLANKTLECIGLNFGAVDVIRTEEGNWKILEVNTAPGVTAESNIEWYTKALLAN